MSRFLRMKEVKRLSGLSECTIYRKIKDGSFPKQVSLGANSVGWLESEILHWKTELLTQRDLKACA